jgi:hypothetical protein
MNPLAYSHKYNPRHSYPTAPPIRRLETVRPAATFPACLRHSTQAPSGRAHTLFAYSETRRQRYTIPIATT